MHEIKTSKYDVAVVGGGIVGLAVAYAAYLKGNSVILFERNAMAIGATIRNFGMVWPIGQPASTVERALKSREIWVDLAQKAGFWYKPCGSLHLVYQEDELNVIEEFVSTTRHLPYETKLLTPLEATEKSKAINPIGLEGALWSTTELNVDPREATSKLHQFFSQTLGITIKYGTVISRIDFPRLISGEKTWEAERIYICTGSDFETLYPGVFGQSGMVKCKLQMMRTSPQPNNWTLGPNLAGGLTLQHYSSFAHCESVVLLKKRIEKEMLEYNSSGIHVMVSQTRMNEITIGDSHEYGLTLSPFDKSEINRLILKYLTRFAVLPNLTIAEYWNGEYAKLPGKTEFVHQPEKGVTIINGLGGAGMTLSFGLAQEIVE